MTGSRGTMIYIITKRTSWCYAQQTNFAHEYLNLLFRSLS